MVCHNFDRQVDWRVGEGCIGSGDTPFQYLADQVYAQVKHPNQGSQGQRRGPAAVRIQPVLQRDGASTSILVREISALAEALKK